MDGFGWFGTHACAVGGQVSERALFWLLVLPGRESGDTGVFGMLVWLGWYTVLRGMTVWHACFTWVDEPSDGQRLRGLPAGLR